MLEGRKMNSYKIIISEKLYRGEILKLHNEGFNHLGEDEYHILRKNFEQTLDVGEAIIALMDSKIIGFQSSVKVGKDKSKKKYLESKLYWAQHPEREEELKQYYQKLADQRQCGNAIIGYFKNQFTNKGFQVNNKDIYLDAIVVHPDYQKSGIGLKLAKKSIELMLDTSSIYVDCLQDSGTESLYSHVGFKSIIRLGPAHISGHSSLLMGFSKKI